MSKKSKKTKVSIPSDMGTLKNEVDQLKEKLIMNGLSEAILGADTNVSQLSQVDTLFNNNRWYMISNMRQLLSQMYVEHGLISTIVDVPVDDGLRGGVRIKTKELDEDDIHKLETKMKRDDDVTIAGKALKWTRLFGGGGIIILTDQDPEKPLDKNKITEESRLEFRAVDMWELYHNEQNMEEQQHSVNKVKEQEFYNYYSVKIHKSRVIIMKGLEAPSFIRPRLRGWGYSVVESLVRSINQYLKATDLTFEILDEFKLDIFKIKGLTSTLLQQDGSAKIQNRVQLANQQKNYQNALTMDSEDDYIQKQLSFAGISETMAGLREQIASDLRMPITKVFGTSSAGFNSGEADIENYNSMVESTVRSKAHFDILSLVELRCQQLFGFVPDDLEIEFHPLRVLSAEGEENVKTNKFNRLLQARQAGEITTREFREGCNKDDLLGTALDTKKDELNSDDLSSNNSDDQTDKKPLPVQKKTNSIEDDYGLENYKGTKVAVVAICSGNEILTGKRRDNGLWVSPAGHVETGEDIKDAAIREAYEESGIKFVSTDLFKVCEKKIITKEGKEIAIFLYKASLEKKVAHGKNDPDQEVSEWKWVEINKDTPELLTQNRHAGDNDIVIEKIVKGVY